MVPSSKLEELKKQVRDASNQQLQIQEKRDRMQEAASYREQEQKENQKEMVQLIRNVFEQRELIAARESELLLDKLDQISHRQAVMNEQLITLNDNLTDLKAVYKAENSIDHLSNWWRDNRESLMNINAYKHEIKDHKEFLGRAKDVELNRYQQLQEELKIAQNIKKLKGDI